MNAAFNMRLETQVGNCPLKRGNSSSGFSVSPRHSCKRDIAPRRQELIARTTTLDRCPNNSNTNASETRPACYMKTETKVTRLESLRDQNAVLRYTTREETKREVSLTIEAAFGRHLYDTRYGLRSSALYGSGLPSSTSRKNRSLKNHSTSLKYDWLVLL